MRRGERIQLFGKVHKGTFVLLCNYLVHDKSHSTPFHKSGHVVKHSL